MSSYREVTKDDVGKVCEFSSDNFATHELFELECIFRKETPLGNRYVAVNEAGSPCFRRQARIRTSPLPDGWLPDDWRVLGDEEQTQVGDAIVFNCHINKPFGLSMIYNLQEKGPSNWCTNRTAKDTSTQCSHHLCVIRPRYRPATKDDVNKFGIGKHDDSALIKAIVERDNQGYDAWCLHKERGWCVARLSEMKVENEGWNVTN
jgi:hypothetical protein